MFVSIILAAGEGSRMKSNIPKCAHKVCGKALINHVVDSAVNAGVEKNIVVLGHKADIVEAEIKLKDKVSIVNQPVDEGAPYGTGYAVKQGEDEFSDLDTVVVLCGDTPLIRSNTIKELMKFHQENDYDITVLTSEFEDPTGYGRILRDDTDKVIGIVEQKDANEEQKSIKEVNSGIYCFKGNVLKDILGKLDNNNAQGEYYITDGVGIVNGMNGKVGGYKITDNGEIQGINSKVQLAEAESVMRNRINNELMLKGAIIIDPQTTYIAEDVEIGRDTIIYPGVVLEGETIIGENCKIGQNSMIVNSNISDCVEIMNSTIVDSSVDENSKIGPYAYLRPKSNIGKDVKIGDFVEIKNAKIGNNTKASHHAYIGDAEVGNNVNIGCGTVFVNYDGSKKEKVIVGDNVFIGCNSNLVSPVKINSHSYIAAGSTITTEVKENSLAIARARQVDKEDWVIKKGIRK
ncbi:MAG: bifunctional UDP-N-acetylglucosamine diphosphorylase/glucosamine-1-phosphate N-acetyltransferase GlmU [Andreesenia angusta]|nr:bifunctional UDP-N-acetylglucosamine diphosphorylase/glucosamine-1-phosphate N-acetyltransferase GlmU [Andreesenia angusta]